ncbi:MarR family winged helix-turn-helix transcriptional regulator [Ancylobacter mangrovi]|uniref:MarR family winged helix-turn-helix transcriptional regulator n=1 Tax=Ancylobacter mangrovi TaxID=2972472 RepID=UPI0021623DFA|nr:MarR family winged helix-turn-helix transcriptional regulator [Ancylobacter mangrovi]MCS0502243.1 MarR family winged helix-turn-helix transcriptional regulator [Ancylobacter mangrovi]
MTVARGSKETDADERVVQSYRLDDQIGFLLRVANQRHTALFMARMVGGLTPPQFATLARLREVGPCSQNRLGRLVYLDAATIKGVVDRLIGRGFVMTADDPLDRRRRAVGLTESGMAIAEEAIEAAKVISAATLEPLEPDEREQMVRLLKKIS